MDSNLFARQGTMFVSGEHCRCMHGFLFFDAKTVAFRIPPLSPFLYNTRLSRDATRGREKCPR